MLASSSLAKPKTQRSSMFDGVSDVAELEQSMLRLFVAFLHGTESWDRVKGQHSDFH